jgi:hypothetical protein
MSTVTGGAAEVLGEAFAAWGDSQRRSRRTGDDPPYAVSNTQLAAADPNTAVP